MNKSEKLRYKYSEVIEGYEGHLICKVGGKSCVRDSETHKVIIATKKGETRLGCEKHKEYIIGDTNAASKTLVYSTELDKSNKIIDVEDFSVLLGDHGDYEFRHPKYGTVLVLDEFRREVLGLNQGKKLEIRGINNSYLPEKAAKIRVVEELDDGKRNIEIYTNGEFDTVIQQKLESTEEFFDQAVTGSPEIDGDEEYDLEVNLDEYETEENDLVLC